MRSSPAASAASARAKPQAAKPSRSASALIASSRLCLLATRAPVHRARANFRRNFSASDRFRKLAAADAIAVEAVDLVKDFGETRAVDGVSLAVPTGSIYGLLGPNGAGKTTTLRMLIGIIDPSSGTRRVLGRERPLEAAPEVGYLPEERGLYPAMHARDAIAFMGALRGLPLAEGRRRADALLEEHDLGEWAKKPIRTLSKGMAQTVQLLGTIVHKPRLIVLDEPFAGLDAINQAQARGADPSRGAGPASTVIFSTHVIAHAERLCERDRDHRQGQGRLRRPGRRGARPAPPDRPPAHARRATARGARPSPRTPGAKATNGCSSFPRAVRSPCSRR